MSVFSFYRRTVSFFGTCRPARDGCLDPVLAPLRRITTANGELEPSANTGVARETQLRGRVAADMRGYCRWMFLLLGFAKEGP
jgi:hypothetical protein